MSTYLFIWTILAGAGWGNNNGPYGSHEWKSGWQQAGLFDAPSSCHKAAVNLGLASTEYRCLLKQTGEVR